MSMRLPTSALVVVPMMCIVMIGASPANIGGRTVSYDQRSFMVDSERLLILSGSIHFTRVPPSDWDRVLKLAKGMGLNTVQTYVFWSAHEPRQGDLDWGGANNITRFIELAHNNGL